MNAIRLLVFTIAAVMLAACAHQRCPFFGQDARVYNPVTRNWEWQNPGQPSTSPGADRTSGQPYR